MNTISERPRCSIVCSVFWLLLVYFTLAACAFVIWNKVQRETTMQHYIYIGEHRYPAEDGQVDWEHQAAMNTFILPFAFLCPFCAIAYIIMVLYSATSHTWQFMKYKLSSGEVLESIQQNRKAFPSIQYEVKCSHVTSSSRTVKDVVSFHTFIDIPIVNCVDASGDLNPSIFHPGMLTRVCMVCIYMFHNSI